MKISFVTGNKEKFKEVKNILDVDLEKVSLDLAEIQDFRVERVVKDKALRAFKIVKKPLIVEDTGLYIKDFGGFPGALSKWIAKTMGYEKLCRILKGERRAFAQTVIGYFDGKNYNEFKGKIEGQISSRPAGKTNFGWDNIFIPKGFQKTFAQLGKEQKNKISMRKIALQKLKKFLKNKKYDTK